MDAPAVPERIWHDLPFDPREHFATPDCWCKPVVDLGNRDRLIHQLTAGALYEQAWWLRQ